MTLPLALPPPLLADTGVPLSIGFCILVALAAVASGVVEYLYARFGESADISWRFVVVSIVLGVLHIFWHTWSQQIDIADASLAPENTLFRLTIWLFLIATWAFPAWLLSGAIQFTWFDRFIPRGLPLVLLRAALCVGLGFALVWMGLDSFSLLEGARLRP